VSPQPWGGSGGGGWMATVANAGAQQWWAVRLEERVLAKGTFRLKPAIMFEILDGTVKQHGAPSTCYTVSCMAWVYHLCGRPPQSHAAHTCRKHLGFCCVHSSDDSSR
jgi:hypothetical protein